MATKTKRRKDDGGQGSGGKGLDPGGAEELPLAAEPEEVTPPAEPAQPVEPSAKAADAKEDWHQVTCVGCGATICTDGPDLCLACEKGEPRLILRKLGLQDIPPGVYVPRHVELRFYMAKPDDRRRAETLCKLGRALDRAGVRLPDGKRTVSTADVLRWVLDQIAAV